MEFMKKRNSSSPFPVVLSTTRIAISVLFRTDSFCAREAHQVRPHHQSPGVSMTTTGPSGSSSMDLYTGSVVVPITEETIARSCPVTALITLDFPAFLFPKKTDMYPFRSRCLIHSHNSSPFAFEKRLQKIIRKNRKNSL